MSACSQCGAPIALEPDRAVVCTYCGASNAPPPKVVEVPVPVQFVQQNVVVNAPAQGGVEGGARCPHCRKLLAGVRVGAVELNGCGGCGGIWVDNQSAQAVVAAPERVFGELARRCSENARGGTPKSDRPSCPSCPAILERVVTHGILLDVCTQHGTWFDALELDQLVRTLRGDAPAQVTVKAGSTATVLCTGCRMAIRADKANITPAGLQCDACWRKQFELEQARVEAQAHTDASTGALVAGGLIGVAAVLLAGSSSRS